VVIDEDKDLWNYFKVVTMPTTLLISQQGNIVYSHSGYKPGDEAELVKHLETLFKDDFSRSQNQ
jgi:thioredoxin-related protein